MNNIEAEKVAGLMADIAAADRQETARLKQQLEDDYREQVRKRQEGIDAAIREIREAGVISLFEELRDAEVVVGKPHEKVKVGKKYHPRTFQDRLKNRRRYTSLVKDMFRPAEVVLGIIINDDHDRHYAKDFGHNLPGVILQFDYYGEEPSGWDEGSWGWSEVRAYIDPEQGLMINGVRVEGDLHEVVARAIIQPQKVSHYQDAYDPGP